MPHPIQAHAAASPSPQTSLLPFDSGPELDYIEQDGQVLFTAEEVGRHLGYANPAISVNKLFRQNENELKHYSTCTRAVQVDGKLRETRAFTEEGVYILSMLARTNEAKRFRARVALLLRRVRREREERMIELARQAGFEAARELLGPEMESAAFENGVQAVLGLTRGQREILKDAVRLNVAGLTNREVARVIGCCLSNVQRALKAVRP